MSRALLVDLAPLVGLVALSCLTLAILLRRAGRPRLALSQLVRLPRDERGAVQSLSFVLTVPLFVMVMLFIVQLSQLTIARVVVEYSAFAAARSAAVWLPASLGPGGETSNQVAGLLYLGDEWDANGQLFSVYQVSANSPKVQRARFAAVLANLAISPSRNTGTALDPQAGMALASLQRAYLATAPRQAANPKVPTRLSHKLAYAWEHTAVEITVRHRSSEPPLQVYFIPPDFEEFRLGEMGWSDQLVVKVTHEFALLPGPGRLLARPTPRPALSGGTGATGTTTGTDQVAARIQRKGSVYVYTLSATATMHTEGEKPLLEFVQQDVGPTRTLPPANALTLSPSHSTSGRRLSRAGQDSRDGWADLPLPPAATADEECCQEPLPAVPRDAAQGTATPQPTPATREVSP